MAAAALTKLCLVASTIIVVLVAIVCAMAYESGSLIRRCLRLALAHTPLQASAQTCGETILVGCRASSRLRGPVARLCLYHHMPVSHLLFGRGGLVAHEGGGVYSQSVLLKRAGLVAGARTAIVPLGITSSHPVLISCL